MRSLAKRDMSIFTKIVGAQAFSYSRAAGTNCQWVGHHLGAIPESDSRKQKGEEGRRGNRALARMRVSLSSSLHRTSLSPADPRAWTTTRSNSEQRQRQQFPVPLGSSTILPPLPPLLRIHITFAIPTGWSRSTPYQAAGVGARLGPGRLPGACLICSENRTRWASPE